MRESLPCHARLSFSLRLEMSVGDIEGAGPACRPFDPAEVRAELASFLDRLSSARSQGEKFGEDPNEMSREAEYIVVLIGDDSGGRGLHRASPMPTCTAFYAPALSAK